MAGWGKCHLGYRDGFHSLDRGFDDYYGFLGGARGGIAPREAVIHGVGILRQGFVSRYQALSSGRPTTTDREFSASEMQAYCKLDLARVDYGPANYTRADRADPEAWIGEDGMVREIEELGAEFNPAALGESKVLRRRKVPFDNSGTDNRVAARVAIAEA